jgi:pyruvate/2-oxoglutarate dehydrogenase complex dihydrolipoamide dehydrogenase (E3) component
MGMALRSDGGHVKLLIRRGGHGKHARQILGCVIVGEQSSVLIHEIIPLMRYGGTLDDILYSIHIHPSLSELVRNAARKAKQALVDAGETIPLKLLGK